MSKKETTLNKIRTLLGIEEEIKLEELKTKDDVTLFAESFEAGEAVYVVDGEERVALPAGDYELSDGRMLVVAEEGVIGELKEGATEEETTEEEMSTEELEAIEAKVKDLAAENEKLKEQLSKPVVPKMKPRPNGKTELKRDSVNLAAMPIKDRVNVRLFGNAKQSIAMKFRKNNLYNANLATTITSNYGGEFAGAYIAAALLSGDTLANNAITIKPNIAFQEAVKKSIITGIITDASCDFTDAGDVTLSDRLLTPKALQVNKQLCKANFVPDWESREMGFSAFKNMPPSFQAFLMQYIAEAIANDVETSIWQGVATNDGEFDGFGTLFQADTDVIDVDNGGTAITAATVIDELGKIVDAIPKAVYEKPDCTIYVASDIYRAYVRALGGFVATVGAQGVDNKGTTWFNGQDISFDGKQIFMAPGLPANEAVAAQASNLWFGTGLMSDHNTVKVLDMENLDGSDNVRYISRFTGGVQYGFGDEVVYYWDSTP